VKKNVYRIVAREVAVASIPLLAGCRSVRWINEGRSGEWEGCVRHNKFILPCGTNTAWEAGLRSDGVVVWREVK
jgi:hypothetical protein